MGNDGGQPLDNRVWPRLCLDRAVTACLRWWVRKSAALYSAMVIAASGLVANPLHFVAVVGIFETVMSLRAGPCAMRGQ